MLFCSIHVIHSGVHSAVVKSWVKKPIAFQPSRGHQNEDPEGRIAEAKAKGFWPQYSDPTYVIYATVVYAAQFFRLNWVAVISSPITSSNVVTGGVCNSCLNLL